MSDALDQALRALRHRDRSTAEVDRYLESRGVGEDERRTALETLTRTDLVDDRRYAERRALSLADRGAGNALIRHELARAGLDPDVVDHALGSLSPERERAEEIVARRGASPKTARYLTGKGFSYDVVEAFIAQPRREALG
jgi:SOS response regulatory protein OraA/RecX